MSPKSDRDRLNPVVPALAILFDVTESCVVAAFRPVNEVKNDISYSPVFTVAEGSADWEPAS